MNTQQLTASLALALLPGFAAAQEGVRSVTLMPGWAEANGSYVGAVRIELEPGWKTYWRTPGEGGIPSEFTWEGSRNLTGAKVQWPTPAAFDTYGMRTIGYDREVVLPVIFEPTPGANEMMAHLHLYFGVCADICIPAEVTTSAMFDLNMVSNTAPIGAALAEGPMPMEMSGITGISCDMLPGKHGMMMLTAQFDEATAFGDAPIVVFETDIADLWIGGAEAYYVGDILVADATMDYFGDGAFILERESIRLNVITPDRVFEQVGC